MEKIVFILVTLLLAYLGGVFTVIGLNRRRKEKTTGTLPGDLDRDYSQLRSELECDRERLAGERADLEKEREFIKHERDRLESERNYNHDEREQLERERSALESQREHIAELIGADGGK